MNLIDRVMQKIGYVSRARYEECMSLSVCQNNRCSLLEVKLRSYMSAHNAVSDALRLVEDSRDTALNMQDVLEDERDECWNSLQEVKKERTKLKRQLNKLKKQVGA